MLGAGAPWKKNVDPDLIIYLWLNRLALSTKIVLVSFHSPWKTTQKKYLLFHLSENPVLTEIFFMIFVPLWVGAGEFLTLKFFGRKSWARASRGLISVSRGTLYNLYRRAEANCTFRPVSVTMARGTHVGRSRRRCRCITYRTSLERGALALASSTSFPFCQYSARRRDGRRSVCVLPTIK